MISPSKTFRENYFDLPIVWSKQADVEYPYVSVFKGISLKVRLNDFPDRPLYTLIVEGEEITHFDDWPKTWSRQGLSDTEYLALARDIKEGTLTGYVGSGTSVTGETTFKAILRVDGYLSGIISSNSGTLIVGANGKVEANIEVSVAVILGTINGDIIATQRLELGRAARVNGDIQTPSLVIEQGAILEGHCRMMQMLMDQPRRVDSSSARTTEKTVAVDRAPSRGFPEMTKRAGD